MSITNFYYFNNNILYKKSNHEDSQGDNGKDKAVGVRNGTADGDIAADGSDIRAVADVDMEIESTCDELPILTGDALISLFPYEEDRLLMIPNSAKELYRARIECEPLDVDIEFCRGRYTITLPEYHLPNDERLAELARLAVDEQPTRIKEFATAYRQLIAAGKEEVGAGNITRLMKRAAGLIALVKGYIIQSVSVRNQRTAPRIKYSEKNFYRLIITVIAAALAMSNGKSPEMICRVGNRVASFRAIFRCTLPEDMKKQLLSGKYNDCSFEGAYGEVYLILSYLRHICHVYGYFLTLEETDDGRISLCITLPLIKDSAAAMTTNEHVDEKWIIALIEKMLS